MNYLLNTYTIHELRINICLVLEYKNENYEKALTIIPCYGNFIH